MRLNTSTPALFALSSLFHLGSSLPFFHRKAAPLEPLARRATYSVVPVDGGPVATGNAPEATTVQTVVQTSAPKTKTIVETDNVTLPAVTDYVLTTKTIDGVKKTQTVIITVTPSASIATTTRYSMIDVNSPSDTTEEIAPPVKTSSSSASSSPPPTPPSSTPLISAALPTPSSSDSSSSTASATSTSPASSTSTTSEDSSSELSTSTSTLSSSSSTSTSIHVTATPTSTKPAYDNGQWKTHYPAWSNSTSTPTAVVKAVQSASSSASTPTLWDDMSLSVSEAGALPTIPAQDGTLRKTSFEKRDLQMEDAPARRSYAGELLSVSEPWYKRAARS